LRTPLSFIMHFINFYPVRRDNLSAIHTDTMRNQNWSKKKAGFLVDCSFYPFSNEADVLAVCHKRYGEAQNKLHQGIAKFLYIDDGRSRRQLDISQSVPTSSTSRLPLLTLKPLISAKKAAWAAGWKAASRSLPFYSAPDADLTKDPPEYILRLVEKHGGTAPQVRLNATPWASLGRAG